MSKAYDSPYAHSCSPERSSALERTPANCALGESRAPCAYNSHRTSALERNVGVTHSLKMLNVLRAQGGQAHLAPLAHHAAPLPKSTQAKKNRTAFWRVTGGLGTFARSHNGGRPQAAES